MITATKKSWIAVKYKNWLRLCGIVLVVVVVIVVVWVIRALVTEGWGSDCPGRAGGGGGGASADAFDAPDVLVFPVS